MQLIILKLYQHKIFQLLKYQIIYLLNKSLLYDLHNINEVKCTIFSVHIIIFQ